MSKPKAKSALARPNEIAPRLYLSSVTCATDPELLEEYNITHIVSIHQKAKATFSSSMGIRYLLITDLDDKPKEHAKLQGHIRKVNEFIHEALMSSEKNRVLVHCLAGVSRSVTFLALYLMTRTGREWQSVLEDIKSKRFQACPNSGFRTVLSMYQFTPQFNEQRNALRAIDELYK